MNIQNLNIKEFADGIAFKVKVQPRASKNCVAGIVEDSLKISLTSPPVDGEANIACIAYIAELFNVSKSQVRITTGEKSRTKIIKIETIDKNQFTAILSRYLA
ncbi:MAG TPA: DUF167 domain-containing protein [Methylomusa anaerophila]|uniref:UPF0235 protein MAMMFC1_03718 n=1 Tax=Methylomusa anaerophila TaxID=1930071 RepID=A0A348APL1_9FIRM|nr:DUF167 domain-containing protein [Methylomusa anaerophila]BBB93009.1 hypothetical protein MAMMFC1_03718 [Methylomusa anaerophila]HML87158.1 DUF167 domain-containing protein [Methylomusa anaerophila]